MIKIAPSAAVHPIGLPDQCEELPLRKEEALLEDNKSESSKLRLKIKK
jgi:hypothetical protein